MWVINFWEDNEVNTTTRCGWMFGNVDLRFLIAD
jgi:hypothetical protein